MGMAGGLVGVPADMPHAGTGIAEAGIADAVELPRVWANGWDTATGSGINEGSNGGGAGTAADGGL